MRSRARALRRPAKEPDAFAWSRCLPIASSSSGTPFPVLATVGRTGGLHPSSEGRRSSSVSRTSRTSLSAPSRSALLTTKISATSMRPAFMACTPSPASGWRMTTTVSAAPATSTSVWPTPTVSITIQSLPAASSTSAASWAAAARPPRSPRLAIDRMNTRGSPADPCIRTRSPRRAPPV